MYIEVFKAFIRSKHCPPIEDRFRKLLYILKTEYQALKYCHRSRYTNNKLFIFIQNKQNNNRLICRQGVHKSVLLYR